MKKTTTRRAARCSRCDVAGAAALPLPLLASPAVGGGGSCASAAPLLPPPPPLLCERGPRPLRRRELRGGRETRAGAPTKTSQEELPAIEYREPPRRERALGDLLVAAGVEVSSSLSRRPLPLSSSSIEELVITGIEDEVALVVARGPVLDAGDGAKTSRGAGAGALAAAAAGAVAALVPESFEGLWRRSSVLLRFGPLPCPSPSSRLLRRRSALRPPRATTPPLRLARLRPRPPNSRSRPRRRRRRALVLRRPHLPRVDRALCRRARARPPLPG